VRTIKDRVESSSSRSRSVVDHAWRFLKFGLVGLSGLAVNSGVLYLATGLFGVHYLLGATIATQASTVWNFLFSDQWVFSDSPSGRSKWQRFWMFWLMNNIALIGRWPILYFFTSVLGINYLISNLISLVIVMLGRYAFSYSVIWRSHEVVADIST